jgi:predicted nucleic acid-binding Zn ribbon protein
MEPIRTGLRNIMRDLLKAQPQEEAALLAWPLVCGKEVATRTNVVSFASGSLTVEVPDPAWRAQLASFAPRYVNGFAELIGPVVREVKFVKHSAISNQSNPMARLPKWFLPSPGNAIAVLSAEC